MPFCIEMSFNLLFPFVLVIFVFSINTLDNIDQVIHEIKNFMRNFKHKTFYRLMDRLHVNDINPYFLPQDLNALFSNA